MADLEKAPLEYSIDHGEGDPVVRIVGELDGSNVDDLREFVEHEVPDGSGKLSFDMSGVRFMDTSGIALLITTDKSVGSLRIVNPSPQVRRVIEVTGLTHVLVMEP